MKEDEVPASRTPSMPHQKARVEMIYVSSEVLRKSEYFEKFINEKGFVISIQNIW